MMTILFNSLEAINKITLIVSVKYTQIKEALKTGNIEIIEDQATLAVASDCTHFDNKEQDGHDRQAA